MVLSLIRFEFKISLCLDIVVVRLSLLFKLRLIDADDEDQ